MNRYLLSSMLLLIGLFSSVTASAAPPVVTWSSLNVNSPGFTYIPSPASGIWWGTNANIADQSPANIKSVVETKFNLSPGALTSVSSCDNAAANTCSNASTSNSGYSFTGGTVFDYLALHFGGNELLFHWDNPITSFTISNISIFQQGISNYRAYSSSVSSVPLPTSAWLLLSGLGFFLIARRKLHK